MDQLKIWAKVSHRNVLPMLGFVMDWGPYPSVVSPWIEKGSLYDHLRRYEVVPHIMVISCWI